MSQSLTAGLREDASDAERTRWVHDVLGIDVADEPVPPSGDTIRQWKQQFAAEQADLTRRAAQVRDAVRMFPPPPGADEAERRAIQDAAGAVLLPLIGPVLQDADIATACDKLDALEKLVTATRTAAELRAAGALSEQDRRAEEAEPQLQRLDKLTVIAIKQEHVAAGRAERAIAGWLKALTDDEQAPDPDTERACRDALDAVRDGFNAWHNDIGALRDEAVEDPSRVTIPGIDTAAEGAARAMEPLQRALDEQIAALDRAARTTIAAAQARLTGMDETLISNLSARARNLKDLLRELSPRIKDFEAKKENIAAFYDDLKKLKEGVSVAKASKQKPSAVLLAYFTDTAAPLLPICTAYLMPRANELLGKGLDRLVELARALQAIGEASADINRWLVQLYLRGTPTATLARYHAARADLANVGIPEVFRGRLDAKLADPGFDLTQLTTLRSRAATKALFPCGLAAFLVTDDIAVGIRVAEDWYGLVGTNRPGNVTEGRIAQGVTANVISQNKQRTVHSTATSSGHAYHFTYIGGVRSPYELHVHEGAPNLHPAWKLVSNPRERVDGRDTYQINGALRTLLA